MQKCSLKDAILICKISQITPVDYQVISYNFERCLKCFERFWIRTYPSFTAVPDAVTISIPPLGPSTS